MKKILNTLQRQDKYGILVKLSLITVLIFVGLFFKPMMYVAFAICLLMVLIEFNINSFYLIGYLLSFMHIFTFANPYGFSFYNLLILFYVFIMTIKTIILFVTKKLKFDYKLIIPFLVLAIYFSIPFTAKFKIVSVLESYVWLMLFYLLIVNRKELNKINLVYVFIYGIFVASILGIFRGFIPTLRNNIIIYSFGKHARYSALFTNPNILYESCIISSIIIYILVYNNKINWKNLFLCIPLLLLGNSSLSRTYFVLLAIFIILAFISIFIKYAKRKLINFLICIITIVTAFILTIPFTTILVDKVVNMPQEQLTTLSSNTDNQEIISVPIDDDINQDSKLNDMFSGRLTIWKHYLRELKHKEIALTFGFGINSAFEDNYPNSHNTFIQIIYEIGIVGCLLLISCVVYLLCHLKFSVKKNIYTLGFIPLIILFICCCTENQFLSQLGNILLIYCTMFIEFEDIVVEKNKEKIKNKEEHKGYEKNV